MKISVSYSLMWMRPFIWRSSVLDLEVESCATIDDLKTKIRAQERWGHEEWRQRWTFEGRHLAGGRTLAECKVREGSVLDLAVDRWGELMEISVLTQAGSRMTRMVMSTDTVAYLKCELQDELEAMEPRVDQQQQQRLFFYGKELQDDRTLLECGMGEGSCLHVVLQSLGESVPLMGATDDDPKLFLGLRGKLPHFDDRKPGTTYTLEVESSDTMDIVKAKIQCEIGILLDQHSVYSFNKFSEPVKDDKSLADYDLMHWEGASFFLNDSAKVSTSLVKFHVVCCTGKTVTLMVEVFLAFDPDWKTKMLKEKIKRMIFSMEQRRSRGGNVYVGSSKTFSSESLDFRDNYISIVLFDGSYVWIKSRDPAHCKGMLVRRRKDRFGRINVKYEPRFKPPREKTPSGETLKFNYLSLGEYHTPEQAAEVWKMAAYYYGKHDGRLELSDGTDFRVPPMPESLSGMEKANWVKAKVKQVREEFRKELEASKDRLLVIPEGFVDVDELMAAIDEAQLEDQVTSSSLDRSVDVAYQRTEMPNTVAVGFEFNTNREHSDEQLNPQVAELLQVNRQLSEQLQQRRDNEQRLLQENEELKRVNEESKRVNKELKRMMLQVAETL